VMESERRSLGNGALPHTEQQNTAGILGFGTLHSIIEYK
jgi:hypothetical protein